MCLPTGLLTTLKLLVLQMKEPLQCSETFRKINKWVTQNLMFCTEFYHDLKLQLNLRLRPPLISNCLSSATSLTKYQKFASQITIFGTSCKRPPLPSDRNHFYSKKFKIFLCFYSNEEIFWSIINNGLSSRKQPPPLSDHLHLTCWVVACGGFDCISIFFLISFYIQTLMPLYM